MILLSIELLSIQGRLMMQPSNKYKDDIGHSIALQLCSACCRASTNKLVCGEGRLGINASPVPCLDKQIINRPRLSHSQLLRVL